MTQSSGISCRENTTHIPSAVMPRAGGASSIPEAVVLTRDVSGLLDRPLSRAMNIELAV